MYTTDSFVSKDCKYLQNRIKVPFTKFLKLKIGQWKILVLITFKNNMWKCKVQVLYFKILCIKLNILK